MSCEYRARAGVAQGAVLSLTTAQRRRKREAGRAPSRARESPLESNLRWPIVCDGPSDASRACGTRAGGVGGRDCLSSLNPCHVERAQNARGPLFCVRPIRRASITFDPSLRFARDFEPWRADKLHDAQASRAQRQGARDRVVYWRKVSRTVFGPQNEAQRRMRYIYTCKIRRRRPADPRHGQRAWRSGALLLLLCA